jgi:alkylation response protein AidB-like acyl-CoA dehydrogenase
MTQDHEEIRGLARDFALAELRPHNERWDAGGALDAGIIAKVAELGFFGMLVPESDGGMGFDAGTYVAALEELAWGEPAVALLVAHSAIAAELITRHGSAEQRALWLPPLAAGEMTGCIAFSEDEPQASAGALQTRAERAGDGWRVRGRKRWVANGDRADLVVTLAGTPDGAALFVLQRTAGVETAGRPRTLGMRPAGLVDLAIDAQVDEAARLDLGGADPRDEDALGRLSTAGIALGIAQAALDHAVRYSGEREQFGQPIRRFEGIQHKLAGMVTRILAARGLVERAAADMDDAVVSAAAKLAASECAMYVTTEAVQIFGGYGYMRDYPVEKLMRDAKATELMHGPSDVQRLRIAESLHA